MAGFTRETALMMRALLASVAAALMFAGCAAPDAPPTGATVPASLPAPATSGPTPGLPSGSATADACREGEGDLFLSSKYAGSFLPEHMRPDVVEIARDGTIRVLKGHTDPGPGEMSAEEGALDGLTMEEAAAMLARFHYTYETEHLVIARGDEAEIPNASFASFCQSLTSALPTLRDEYPHGPGCENALVLTWEISVASGARTISMSDCAEHAAEFETVKRDFQRLVGPG